MSPASPSLRVLRGIAAILAAAIALPGLGQSCTTTITGKVYSPNGVDPLPNILVYVPTTAVQPLPQGLSTCAAASELVSGNPLVSTTTAADGSFSLTNANLAGTQTLVIQAGKWRRQYPGVVISACQTNAAPVLAMPQNHTQGDIPEIAISTGGADALECVFRKIGISDSEFTAPSGTGRINLYAGSGTPGVTIDASGTTLPSETTLVSNQAKLNGYDLALFACQGTPNNPAAANTTNQQNVVNFANVGGRVFTTHYSYVWLNNSTVFAGTANWVPDVNFGSATVAINATIDQSYAEGVILAQWLYNIGATPTKGILPLYDARKDQSSINNPPSQSWATLIDAAEGNPVMQFTFDTPLNSAATPTVTLGFVNNPFTFQPGDPADTITVNVANTSAATAADYTLNLSIVLPAGVTATSLAGANPGTGWICSTATLTCNRTSPLAAGATDPVLLVLKVSPTAPLGDAVVTATAAGGGLSGTNQCGRVLFNEYHVETVSTGSKTFPAECENTAMTAQEKFLEFSLYNLSNFIAPAGNDLIDIVANTVITWPTPAAVPYGTPLSATQLDATATVASSGNPVPGTYVYTPAAGTILNTGTNTLNVAFTPTDTTSYNPATGTTTLVVTQDTTTTTLTSSVNPSVVSQSVTFTATVTGSNAAPTGTVNFYDGTNLIGTGTLNATTGDVATATFSTSILAVGSHNITAAYPNNTNFGPSASGVLVQVVTLAASSIAINGLVSPIYYGQIIGNTAVITVTGFAGGGTSMVYIDNVLVCTLPVNAGQTYTCPASTGVGYNSGVHTIYAAYSGDSQYAPSTSPTYTVTILPDNTTTTLTSSNNPIVLNQPVTFTATVTAPYATPIGAVTFSLGGVILATVPVNAQGVATFTTSALPGGADTIVASYPASLNFNASSTSLVEQVNIPMPRFSLTVTPNPIVIEVNTVGPATVTTADIDGFSQPVQLSCSGLPAETTCVFTQSLLPAAGGSTQVSLTPAAPHSCKVATAENTLPGGRGLWLAVVGLALVFARRRRRLLQGLTLAAALLILPMINGCGNCTDLGVLPGDYTITVTGTSTGTPVLTNSVTVTMTVKY
jgi:MYXO-CTERM domain-containing protein